MTNGEKILVGIVVIAAIITTIIVITSNNAKNKIENQKNEINNIEHYLNGVDENKTNNSIADNEIKATSDKGKVGIGWARARNLSDALKVPEVTFVPAEPDGENGWYKTEGKVVVKKKQRLAIH